ncbi:putative major facilitator superfamily [Trypanosoma grayi]|uniref:putative major facilitator superfamily n=1 Tax=Trypanosoma grayi TaxID=71804 RepID=UPI0004F4B948|nr:putative major facilitator superfamily [Trypanosoma grayi]KEG11059.1 putative major facilitator superfamily [Trypanosoma grayi]
MADLHEDADRQVERAPKWYEVLKEEVLELRWRVLAVACFLTFGSYYIFDFPGSLGTGGGHTIEQRFRAHGKAYTQEMNQMLYSVYSWPNTVLAIFGGLLIDKYLGIRTAMLLFTFLILLGAFLFWLGVHFVAYPLMVAARVVFGLGGESLSVSQSAYVARWFKNGRGMALAFGITISFSRVGSSFNFLFSPKIARSKDVDTAVLVGIFACCISFIACMILVAADIYAVRIGYIKPEPRESEEARVMKLSDALKLPFAFWALTAVCVFCYTAIFPFVGIGKGFFEVKYGYDGDKAASYISAYQFASAAGSPLIGIIVDAVGRNTLWLILASTCFVLIHVLLIVSMIPGIAMMIMMGGFYSFLVAGLWPSIPWAVNENIVGFSYGVMTALQNVGLATFPIIVGDILDRYTPHSSSEGSAVDLSSSMSNSGEDVLLPALKGYVMTELLFIGSAGVSFVASVVLLLSDLRNGGILTASSTRRKQMETEGRNALLDYLPEEERNLLFSAAFDQEDAWPGASNGSEKKS